MSKLQRDVKSGFDTLDAQSITLIPRLNADGTLLRIDAAINFRVSDLANNEIEVFEGFGQDVSLDVMDWYTPAFRAAAWEQYKASKGYTEIA